MALSAGYIMVTASLTLLFIYGADEAAVGSTGEGFLPIDTMTRGIGLGVPSIILAFAAFFVSRHDPSRVLGGLIIVSGAIIVMGGITPLLAAASEGIPALAGGLLAVGAVVIALGIIKIIKSR